MVSRIIDLKKTILEDNDQDAEVLRTQSGEQGFSYMNLMSSPGSGKTSSILALMKALNGRLRVGVMEADIDSDVDAETMLEAGLPAVQLHTGGMCHLDAEMSRQGLRALGTDGLDLVILENVGNLVCPAEFDTGADLNVVILSVPEGDDKPLKYPLMFTKCDAVLINKIDAAPVFDFDMKKCCEGIRLRNRDIEIFPVSARTGEGFGTFADWVLERVRTRNARSGA